MKQTDEMNTVVGITCTRCGCMCDDLAVKVEGPRIASISPPCPLADSWYRAQRGDIAAECWVSGQVVDAETAFRRAAAVLDESLSPLIFGTVHGTTTDQQAAVALADRLGARLEIPNRQTAEASLMAFQTAGASTATLGEIRARADLVIYWGCDPVRKHPRHLERFVESSGRWIPDGRSNRYVVAITTRSDVDLSFADHTLHIDPETQYALITQLRSLLGQRGESTASENQQRSSDETEICSAEILDIAHRMQNCRYGVIFYGDDMVNDPVDAPSVESLHRLVTELNASARFTLRYMAGSGNPCGASNVATWQTGYPNHLDFGRGYPRYEPVNPSSAAARYADAVVVVGSDSFTEPFAAQLQSAVGGRLAELPIVFLSDADREEEASLLKDLVSTVEIRTATTGIHAGGVGYRMDEVPLPIRPVFDSALPTAADVLNAIRNTLVVESDGE